MAETIRYDPATLKRELRTLAGIDFQVHSGYTLIRVRTKDEGPIGVIRCSKQPPDTLSLVDVVQSSFAGLLHSLVVGYTLSTVNGSYHFTRNGNDASAGWPEASHALDLPIEANAMGIVEASRDHGYKCLGPGARIALEVQAVEWGAIHGALKAPPVPAKAVEPLDPILVQKLQATFGRLRGLTGK